MLTKRDKYFTWAARDLMLLMAVLVLCTFRDYGITWDEELQSQYGLAVVDYYLSWFQDHRYAEIFNLYLYGGMFDGFASVIDRFTPFTLYETRHLLNAFFGLLGLWGTWKLGRFMGGPVVGFLSVLMLALTPMYYGHMFNNPKDIPFAAGIMWSTYYMGRCFTYGETVPLRLVIKLGVILGLTLGVRVGGVMLLSFWLGVLAWGILRNQKLRLSVIKNYALRFVLPVTLCAYVIMLVCWPWAQQNPIINPLRALSEFSNFPQDVEVLLNGTSYRSTQLPWFYVPLYFGVQLPEFLLVLLVLSIPAVPFLRKNLTFPRRQTLLLMGLMGSFPTAYALLRHPALYDAVRHFLFAVPLACVMCALTAQFLVTLSQQAFITLWAQRVVLVSCGALAVIVVSTQMCLMIQLHPYEYIFVNQFVGGVAGAYGKYELDYWGSSFKEATAGLQNFVAAEGGVPPGKIYKVAICGPWSAAMIYLPPDYEPVIANAPAEFFLATTRWMCPKMRPGEEIVHVTRAGVPLAVIKDLRNGYEYYEGNEKNRR